MSMKDAVLSHGQGLLPQHWLSRLLGALADSKRSKLKQRLIQMAIKRYHIDLSDALKPSPEAYESFNAFFTRALKPDARPLPKDPNVLISPADGCISQIGQIQRGQLLQAKGHEYSLLELLGGETQHAQTLKKGKFATIYLSPRDYHRVHMPFAGHLTEMTYVPGKLFSVNPMTASQIPGLFARNERVIAFFETEIGPMAVILVGAFFVASIATTWHGIVAPSASTNIQHWQYADKPFFERGVEIGHFQFGSTVILITPENAPDWCGDLAAGDSVRMGQALV